MARVLIGCESSGIVREAFRRLGHDAWSCDLLAADDGSPYHFQQDVLEVARGSSWDLMIAHPPCTFLCRAGIHWNSRRPERAAKTEEALRFFIELDQMEHIPKRVLENPIGIASTRHRRHDQTIHPWQFGHDAEKTTNLWITGLPLLEIDPALRVPGRLVDGRERWSNQTDSGQNRESPGKNRWKKRSQTYPGIANAMATQWSRYL